MFLQTVLPAKLAECVAREGSSLSTANTHSKPPQNLRSTNPRLMPPAPQNKSMSLYVIVKVSSLPARFRALEKAHKLFQEPVLILGLTSPHRQNLPAFFA
jgi:hypothetical protein